MTVAKLRDLGGACTAVCSALCLASERGLKRDYDASPRLESIKPLDFVKVGCCRGASDRNVEVTPEVARERERATGSCMPASALGTS